MSRISHHPQILQIPQALFLPPLVFYSFPLEYYYYYYYF